jgi:hypothetical protein
MCGGAVWRAAWSWGVASFRFRGNGGGVTPYWKRRIEGQRAGDWAMFILGLWILGINALRLFRPQPLDGLDYFVLFAWTFYTCMRGFLLFRRRRPSDVRDDPEGPGAVRGE